LISINEIFFSFQVRQGAAGPNLTWFLMVNFSFLLVMVALVNFQARKSVGMFLLITYIVFLLFVLLGEFGAVHPYGTDHIDESKME
jgi:solute carrier family 24 (sodium/potassium/calcium exchanger), member 6